MFCPACGSAVADVPAHQVTACPRCGAQVRADAGAPALGPVGSRTIPMRAPPSGAAPSQKTLMGGIGVLPGASAQDVRDAVGRTQVSGTPQAMASGLARYDALTDPERAMATIVDVPVFARDPASAPPAGAPRGNGTAGAQRTLLGVARPGIAPLRPGVQKTPAEDDEPDPPSYAPLQELGATMRVSPEIQRHVRAKIEDQRERRKGDGAAAQHPLGHRRLEKLPNRDALKKVARDHARRSRSGLYVVLAALALAVSAIGVAFLWPSAPPLRAQVRAGEAGSEILDLECEDCADGTTLSIRDGEGTVQGKRASIPLSAPLTVGDTELRVSIDRPGSGRDETVRLPVRVAYRVRPELTSLDADRPSIQIVVDAMEGSRVVLDGEEIPLRDGRAAKSIDVSKELLGPSGEAAAQLSRKVSFTVTPPDGTEERGAVAVTVPVLPLTVEAPGRAVVTELATFVLAGKTMPGAEIVVAGRSIGVTRDGAFSQTMNVSSVGATQIEVRARMAGRAPRLVRISVERVASLDAAAAEFARKQPLDYAALVADPAGSTGKLAALEGEVVEVAPQGPATVVVLAVEGPSCAEKKCLARLVQGRSDLGLTRGARLRAFGTALGNIAYQGASVPDLDVAFSLPAKEPR